MEAWGLPQTHWALVSNGANSQRSKLGELGDTWLWCRGRLEVQIPLDDAPCSDSCPLGLGCCHSGWCKPAATMLTASGISTAFLPLMRSEKFAFCTSMVSPF